jgi:hypothetical protein
MAYLNETLNEHVGLGRLTIHISIILFIFERVQKVEFKKSNNKVSSKYMKVVIIIAGIVMLLSIAFSKVHSITAYYEGNKLVYIDNYYKEYYAHYDASDKLIGFIKYPFDGIYALENDNTYNYLYVSEFTDQYLFIKEGTVIPKSGGVTMVLINYHTDEAVTSREDIDLILSLENQKGETFFKDDIPKFTNNVPHNSSIYYCYNNCPVSEYTAGEIWYVEGKWVYFSMNDSGKGVVINDQDIAEELKRIFVDIYKSANE